MSCDFCTGTNWLGDDPEKGPCACADLTAALTARDEALDKVEEIENQEDRIGDIHEALGRYFVRTGIGHNPIIIDDPDLREAWEKASS